MITVRTRWRREDYTAVESGKASLVHPVLGTLSLPWWPSEVERSNLARSYSEFARPGLAPLLVATARPLDEYNAGFRLVACDPPPNAVLDVLRGMADSPKPVMLVMAQSTRGLFHVTALTIAELQHTPRGLVSDADVSMTLKRASDVSVKVGPVKRGSASNMARKVK